MEYLVKAPIGSIQTQVKLPASKSISNRVLILNALSYSSFDIKNLSDCNDTQVMINTLNSNSNHFDIKAAGTAMRFLTAFLSKIMGEWTITGTERMKQRPIKVLVDALLQLGARIEYIEQEGYPPLRIYGSALQGGEISLPSDVSSQYISALLMIAPYMEKGLTMNLEGDIISRPYIQLTLSLMEQFGVKSTWKGNYIHVDPQTYTPIPFTVESDWSAASYWYQIMALSSEGSILLKGLSKKSLQGDAATARLFEKLGVHTSFSNKGVTLSKRKLNTQQFSYNFVNEPDLAQTFAVTCVMLNIPFHFEGLQSLKIKETDRIEALITEMRKLGYVLKEPKQNCLSWDGEKCEALTNAVIATYEDHRMAMAFAPIACMRKEGIRIADPDVVNKSYVSFWNDLQKAGFLIQ